ncbi:MAG: hypothetical protein JWQ09_5343 [Segetibacter sp.]|nr:hypothetical protein [Segetibacter sp.]
MADIFHTFPVNAPSEVVFECISTAEGLDSWWSESSECKPELGGTYKLSFGPGYNWTAVVTKYIANKEFELTFTDADDDWIGSKVGFSLEHKNDVTEVQFYHTGWPQINEHYKISSYCWAMYLRILKRYVEHGEQVPYEERLNV